MGTTNRLLGTGVGVVSRTWTLSRDLVRGVVTLASPQTCVCCGEWIAGVEGMFCHACRKQLDWGMSLHYCRRCGRTQALESIHEEHCGRCKHERFWNVAGLARVGLYTPRLQNALLDLKYRGRLRNADAMAGLLAAVIRKQSWAYEIEALVPVPMHWLRRLQRPCNHANVLATETGKRLGVPVIPAVGRTRHGRSQVDLPSMTQRFKNVEGCFAIRAGWLDRLSWRGTSVKGRTVCIIDNLAKTGATLYEVSKVLRKAGAKRIYAAVVSRPASPGDPVSRPGGDPW